MQVGVQQKQTLLVTTEHALWRYDNAFRFTNQSEVDFGIAHICDRQNVGPSPSMMDDNETYSWCVTMLLFHILQTSS